MSTDIEAPPAVPWTFYGVPICHVGEDGDLLALGHVEPRRFVAAALALGRDLGLSGEEILGDTVPDPTSIKHLWGVFAGPSECEPEAYDWMLETGTWNPDKSAWTQYNQNTPNVQPVTFWESW